MECKHETPIIIFSIFHVFKFCADCMTLFCDGKPINWKEGAKERYLKKCKKEGRDPSIDMLKVLE